jgi:hypothetical protein
MTSRFSVAVSARQRACGGYEGPVIDSGTTAGARVDGHRRGDWCSAADARVRRHAGGHKGLLASSTAAATEGRRAPCRYATGNTVATGARQLVLIVNDYDFYAGCCCTSRGPHG